MADTWMFNAGKPCCGVVNPYPFYCVDLPCEMPYGRDFTLTAYTSFLGEIIAIDNAMFWWGADPRPLWRNWRPDAGVPGSTIQISCDDINHVWYVANNGNRIVFGPQGYINGGYPVSMTCSPLEVKFGAAETAKYTFS